MVKEGGNVESQSLSISSLFPHYLSISSQPGCKAATIRAALQLSILKVDFFVTRSSQDEYGTGSYNHLRSTNLCRSQIVEFNRSKNFDPVLRMLSFYHRYVIHILQMCSDVQRCFQIITDVLGFSLDVLGCSQYVLRMFSGCSQDVLRMFSGIAHISH